MKRMRRLSQAMDEIRLEDPNTALTPWHLRQMVLTGDLPCHRAGRTILIDIDVLFERLEGKSSESKVKEVEDFIPNHIRRVTEVRR